MWAGVNSSSIPWGQTATRLVKCLVWPLTQRELLVNIHLSKLLTCWRDFTWRDFRSMCFLTSCSLFYLLGLSIPKLGEGFGLCKALPWALLDLWSLSFLISATHGAMSSPILQSEGAALHDTYQGQDLKPEYFLSPHLSSNLLRMLFFLLLNRIDTFPLCWARERQNDLAVSCVDLQGKPPWFKSWAWQWCDPGQATSSVCASFFPNVDLLILKSSPTITSNK